MIARNAVDNTVDVLTASDEEERLRAQVKKLFQQLDSAEQEFQGKEEALRQAIGLLTVLSRPAVELEVRTLIDRLGQEVRKGGPPSTLTQLVTDIKEIIVLDDQVLFEDEVPAHPIQKISSADQPERTSGAHDIRQKVSSHDDDLAERQAPHLTASAVRSAPSKRVESKPNRERESAPVLAAPRQEPSRPTAFPAVGVSRAESELEEKLRAVFTALLERFHAEGQKGLSDKIVAARITLTEHGLLHRLADVRLQFADLLECYQASHETERARLEEVLKEFIGRLVEIEKNVVASLLENHKETMADNARFTERLEGQVVNMQEVAQSKDLEAIRKAVATQTDRMRTAIQAKREADTALAAAFESRVHTLEKQLRDANRQLSSMTERAYHDPLLDDVYNRMAFNEKLKQELAGFDRYRQPVSLLLFDLDRFKQVNDTHGHHAGDHVLRTLATRVKLALRAPDFFARFGGDEFALIMPNTTLAGAVIVAERLRALTCDTTFTYEAHTLQLSLSIGVATARTGDTIETIVERSDQALYVSKENGRNQVRTEDELPPPPPSTLDKMIGFFAKKLPFRKGKHE